MSHTRLRHETGAKVLPMVLAAVAAVVVLVFFLVDTLQNEPWAVVGWEPPGAAAPV